MSKSFDVVVIGAGTGGYVAAIRASQLGKTVALSAAALAADVGLAWLRRRIEAGPAAAPTALARSIPGTPAAATPRQAAGSIVTIVSQRVIEIWDSGDGKRQISERHFWRRMEE